MNRVCLTKDGTLIEMQSGGKVERIPKEVFQEEKLKEGVMFTDGEYQIFVIGWDAIEAMRLDTLKQNALNAGYKEEEIDVKWVTDEEWAVIQEANKPIPTYAELRRAEYPPAEDYLDGIVKGDTAQVQKYIADCLAVKTRYPKP